MITLPYPPSANRYWRNVKGVTLVSKEARAYKDEAGWTALSDGPSMITEPVSITIHVYRPRKSGDLDNYLKIVLDAMQGVLYKNDSQIVGINALRFDDKENPRIEIEVKRWVYSE